MDPTAAVMRTSIGSAICLKTSRARQLVGKTIRFYRIAPDSSRIGQLPFFVNATAFKTAKNSIHREVSGPTAW